MPAIKITIKTKDNLPLKSLIPFQDDIKTLPKERYEKLRKSVLKYGVFLPFFIWKHKGKNYIADGHQRRVMLLQMIENEAYTCPNLPVVYVPAASYAEAKQKVLIITSQYGVFSDEGFDAFIKSNKLKFEEIVSICNFPDFDFGDFAEKFLNITTPGGLPEPLPDGSPDMKSGSDGVKQVQLFFGAAQHSEFMQKIDDLAKIYKTDNVTDTVMASIRADHKTKK